MNWKLWLEGLASAAIGGAATGVTQLVSSTGQVNKGTGISAIIGAILGVGLYLKPTANQSAPAPSDGPAISIPKPTGAPTSVVESQPAVKALEKQ